MQQLSQAGQQVIAGIARQHGFSVDAVMAMLDAVVRGNGSMAQYSHGEFSGSGLWVRGGMTMVSDTVNNPLKGRGDSQCGAVSVARVPAVLIHGPARVQLQLNGHRHGHGTAIGIGRHRCLRRGVAGRPVQRHESRSAVQALTVGGRRRSAGRGLRSPARG